MTRNANLDDIDMFKLAMESITDQLILTFSFVKVDRIGMLEAKPPDNVA